MSRELGGYPLALRPKRRVVSTPVGNSFVQTSDEYEYDVLGSLGHYRARLREHRSRALDLSSPQVVREVVHSYLEYDEYDNLKRYNVQTVGGSSLTRTIAYQNDSTLWLLGLSTDVTLRAESLDGGSEERHTEYRYTPDGLVEAIEVQAGSAATPDTWLQTTFTRGPAGLASSITRQPLSGPGRSEHYEYDLDGVYVTRHTNALSHIQYFEYYPIYDAIALSSDENQVVSSWLYDGLGRPHQELPGDAGATTYTYLANIGATGVNIRQETDDGQVVSDKLDAFGRSISYTWMNGEGGESEVASGYDAMGRVTSVFAPKLGTKPRESWTRSYDNLGRIESVTHPNNAQETWAYPSLQKSVHTDVEGRVTEREYTADGQVRQMKRFEGNVAHVTSYEYAPFGLVDRIQGPAGHVVTMAYDALGRRTTLVDGNIGTNIEWYNAFGEVRRVQNGNGYQRDFHYDDLGRIVSRTSEDGVAIYEYDNGSHGIGKLWRSTSPDGVVVENNYSVEGHLSSRSFSEGGETFALDFQYDALGRPLRTLYPIVPGAVRLSVRRDYGPYGHHVALVDEANSQLLWDVKHRDAYDRITEQEQRGVLTTKHTYDDVDDQRLLSSIQVSRIGTPAPPVFRRDYGYYPDGRLHERQDAQSDVHELFSYDDLGRLTTWERTHQGVLRTRSYGFDSAARLTTITDQQGSSTDTTVITYPVLSSMPQPHAPSSIGGVSFGYDDAGRQKYRAEGGSLTREVSYNSFDLPQSGYDGDHAFTFLYDAFGGRFRKTLGGDEITYVDEFYERSVPSGGQPEHTFFVAAESGLVAQLSTTGGGSGYTTRLVVVDESGSPTLLTNDQGEVEDVLLYAPFGSRERADGALASEPPGFSVGMTGHEVDAQLRLINMGGRMYDPQLRGFLSADPFLPHDTIGGVNRYAYASGDPVNHWDPFGFQTEGGGGGAGSGAGTEVDPSEGLIGPLGGPTAPPTAGPGANSTGHPVGLLPNTVCQDMEMMFHRYADDATAGCLCVSAAALTIASAGMALEVFGFAEGAVGVGTLSAAGSTSAAAATSGGSGLFGGSLTVSVMTLSQRTLPAMRAIQRHGRSLLQLSNRTVVQFMRRTAQRIPAMGSRAATLARAVAQRAQVFARSSSQCFVAGTMVQTATGAVPIEDIREGDLVLTRAEEDGAPVEGEVVWVKPPSEASVLNLVIADEEGAVESYGVTVDHPFWVRGFGWTPAGELWLGAPLVGVDGELLRVEGFTTLAEAEPVYNFEVAEFHSYFVGESGVWVHNNDCAEAARRVLIGGKPWRALEPGSKACLNGCDAVAEAIKGAIGGSVRTIRPPPMAVLGRVLNSSGELVNPAGSLARGWFSHTVVLKDGRIYDAFTGPQGMAISAYKKLWEYGDVLNFGF